MVDDEASIATTTAAILETNGFETEIASSAHGAKELLAVSPYDLVVIDLKMETETAGFDVADFAANRPKCPVVIIVSAYAGLAADWRNHGVDAFFQKPTNTADMLAAIKHLLTQRASYLRTAA